MKYLVDAQLPKSLAELIRRNGQDAVHTLELPSGNYTTDKDICTIADGEQMVVITKDADFLQSHTLNSTPRKLIIIHTGNIKNSKLLEIFKQQLQGLTETLTTSNLIELHEDRIVVHGS